MTRHWRLLGATLLATAAMVAGTGTPALAAVSGGTANGNGTQVAFTATPGAANAITASFSGTNLILDDVLPLIAGPGCVGVGGDDTKVSCPVSANPAPWVLIAHLGDGDDSIVNQTSLQLEAHGGSGRDTLTGGDDRDKLYGDGNHDTLYGLGGFDALYGGSGEDTIRGGEGFDEIHGEVEADKLYGDNGDDRLYGANADDTIDGGFGHDTIDGGTGNDTLHGGESGADVLYGGEGNDSLTGNGDRDRLYGGYGEDAVDGGTGDDLISGGLGRDDLRGGAGADTVDYTERGQFAPVTVVLPAPGETSTGGTDLDTLASLEIVQGGAGADHLTVEAANGEAYGNGGDDQIFGPSWAVAVELYGGEGNDDIEARQGSTAAVDGGNGDDHIYGSPGPDRLTGERGDDYLLGWAGNDIVLGGDGNDGVFGGAGDDYLRGDAGIDRFNGGGAVSTEPGDICVVTKWAEGWTSCTTLIEEPAQPSR